MSELKKICIKILFLILDIIVLGYDVAKQIILPTFKRKGNVLLSLFVFFIGFMQRLTFFEYRRFSITALFRKKYVKQAIFVIGFVLFLLSLFEWTGDQRICNNNIESTSTEQLLISTGKKAFVAEHKQATSSEETIASYQSPSNTRYNISLTHTHPPKRFLLNCSLRV